MSRPADIRRVIVVVLDGLRPDAIGAFDLHHLHRLAEIGAATNSARTVAPSLTWPALTSLMCGVSPDVHGIVADSVHLPRPRTKLLPLAALLALSGYPCTAFMGQIPSLYRGVAGRIARGLGFAEARFAGVDAHDVLMTARATLRTQRRGLVFMHWADADRAGHDHGWMSPQYAEATRGLDSALGLLANGIAIETDPHTLLVAVADHGGGGVDPAHHMEAHPVNWTIPLILAGGSVRRTELGEASLLDVPATIAWSLGVAPPGMYAGRVLVEAFRREGVPGAATAVA